MRYGYRGEGGHAAGPPSPATRWKKKGGIVSIDVTDQTWLDSIFPASRTDAFFEALFGGAEDGAYDIRLTCRRNGDDRLEMAFDLHQRPGRCLRCSLTYGLPNVFQRHPVLDVAGVAQALAQAKGWKAMHWDLGATEDHGKQLHCIPFTVYKDGA